MKKVFYFLLVAMFCSAFVGCSKDDAGEISKDNYEDAIVGTWDLEKAWDEDWGEYEYFEEGEWTLRFQAGGTGYIVEEEDRWGFDWEIDGSWLYMEDYDGYEDEAKIKKLTNTELVLSYYDGDYIEYYKRSK